MGAENFSESKEWQRLYQYKNNKSKIQSQIFFFSKEGMTNPKKELDSAILAFQDTKTLYGTLQLPAACAFPARKYLLEKKLKLKFPQVKCLDLDAWIERINADSVSIDFAGAYSGNPASILGHTFLRYYKTDKNGHDLLSHAVGFLAVSPPTDSRAIYMVKGLTGRYPGYYQIEPFYMKVGIYNNSESRDIWEQKLNLTPEEVKLSLYLLWEYSFNAEIPYYFIDENCSYRLLSFLEVIKPEVDLLSELSPVVLPSDTVRILLKHNLASVDPQFRSSILRRLNLKVEDFTKQERVEFKNAQHSLEALNEVNNIKILDALIDYWTYTNYRAETNLKPYQASLMEATFLKRSKILEKSSKTDDRKIQSQQNLIPTYLGHKTAWMSASGGGRDIVDNDFHGRFSYRMGSHAITDDQAGYEDIAAIEYLGFDIESRGEWRALLIDAKSIEALNRPEKKWSWLADISLDNNEFHSDLEDTRLVLKGGGGGAYEFMKSSKFYFMPIAKSEIAINSEWEALLGVGLESGIIFHHKKISMLLMNESIWNRTGFISKSKANLSYHMMRDHTVFSEYSLNDYNFDEGKVSSKTALLGYKLHF